jgi:undecaprenyl diphosphate synthase
MSPHLKFIKSLPQTSLPRHVVLVIDGNRRWAQKHNLHPWEGHRAGSRAVDRILRMAYGESLKISSLSFWALSLDNVRNRPKRELYGIYKLAEEAFEKLLHFPEIHKSEVKINAFGEWQKYFPKKTKEIIKTTLRATSHYNRYTLNFFLAYDGYKEILDAVENIRKNHTQEPLTPALFKKNLYTKDLPPVDYVIRTGGEPHWSAGAFLWEAGYSQLYFTRKLWPDFTQRDFLGAIVDYTKRKRRFGK